jgi:3-keto-5-aminohexanoate cleavage enzyme
LSEKVIITAALTGATTKKEQNPAVPYTPEEFAEEAYRCYQEGATIVHIHARHPETGEPTSEIEIFKRIIEKIREKTPIILNLSTGVRFGATEEERIRHIIEFRPEIASLNTNTMNMSFFNKRTGELLQDNIFYNSFTQVIKFAKIMKELKVKPELEVYDIGHIHNVLLLQKQNLFEEPLYFNFVFGVAGGIDFTPFTFTYFLNTIPKNSIWSTTGVGVYSFLAATQSIIAGGNVRVGLEDNIYLKKGVLAKGSWELVRKVVQIMEMFDKRPATLEETKEILGLRNE